MLGASLLISAAKSTRIHKNVLISPKNLSVVTIQVPEKNRVYPINNISHLTTEEQPISDHEKKSKPSPKEKKTRTKLKLSSKMIE